MGKWRPSNSCLYVIPDIHGMPDELQLIFNRILPLRNTGGHKDKIIFLGDYIDRRIQSHMVIDLIIEAKEKYKDQIITLLGNHEIMMLDILSKDQTIDDYNLWMQNGGEETVIGYLQRNESDIQNPYLIKRHDINRLIPKDHIEFFKSLIPYYETEEYIFVHGGCDPLMDLKKQDYRVLAWDRSVYNTVQAIADMGAKCPWYKTIVTGHNGNLSGNIFTHDKFIMLDGSLADKLYVLELNSRECFSATKDNQKLVKEISCF